MIILGIINHKTTPIYISKTLCRSRAFFAQKMIFYVLCGINLKLFGMTEVLKDLSVLISYCNFHCAVSLGFSIVKDFNAFLN